MFENPITHKALSEVVAEEIRNRIWKHELSYGERIIEAEMAEQFGISRSTLREALKLLEHEMLIINKSRKGSFVNVFTEKDSEEIKEIRVLLEGPALIQAANNFTKDDENYLEKLLRNLKQRIDDEWFEALT